ncbi:MAG: hypothetical protein A2036_03925 [Omnitrophica bacterium GWA2_50_21]|nr:MAG: hypothetical protein A2036_03925 [Omnitrophica bacterium GWA2_50_21]
MPVQVSKKRFVQFKYDPKYLKPKKYRKTRTNAAQACESIGINPEISQIKLDGGNVVRSRTKVIMTRSVFTENPDYSERGLLLELKQLFRAKEIIIVPECPYDPYGHSDGMIRFIDGEKDEASVFVNDFSKENPKFVSEFHETLSIHGLKPVFLPYTAYRNKGDDATGIYVNYLQVGKAVLYPVYGQKEDLLAHRVFTKYYGANAIPIRANGIAKDGGVLNCISWNIFRKEK